jgi:hypothetical protein
MFYPEQTKIQVSCGSGVCNIRTPNPREDKRIVSQIVGADKMNNWDGDFQIGFRYRFNELQMVSNVIGQLLSSYPNSKADYDGLDGDKLQDFTPQQIFTLNYDYSKINERDRNPLKNNAINITLHIRDINNSSFYIGQELIEAKARLIHGQWLDWLTAEFNWDIRQAERFMNVAKKFGSNPDSIKGIRSTVLGLLAAPSVPEEAVDSALRFAPSGNLTVANAKAIIEQHRNPTATPEPLKTEVPGYVYNSDGKFIRESDGEIIELSEWRAIKRQYAKENGTADKANKSTSSKSRSAGGNGGGRKHQTASVGWSSTPNAVGKGWVANTERANAKKPTFEMLREMFAKVYGEDQADESLEVVKAWGYGWLEPALDNWREAY